MYLINYSTLHKISHVKILWTKWNWLNKHPFMKKSTVLFPLYNSIFKQPNVIQPKAIYRFIYSDEKRLVLVEGGGSWILIGGVGWEGNENPQAGGAGRWTAFFSLAKISCSFSLQYSIFCLICIVLSATFGSGFP